MKRAFPQPKLATLVISQAIILMMMPAHALKQMWLCHFA